MKPAPFTYVPAGSTDEVVEQLAQYGPDARVLAGGQSLVRLMNTRLASPALLVDINGLSDLDRIDSRDGGLAVGALTRQRTAELSAAVRQRAPLLAEAAALVAHPSVRARGTVVGSLCFADPSAELPAALLALDGEVVARSTRGERVIPADDFFVAPHATSLAADEFAVEVRIPGRDGPRTGSAFLEVSRRHGELPVCAAAAMVSLDPPGRLSDVRIVLCAVAGRPVRAQEAESALTGAEPTEDDLVQAAHLAAEHLTPVSDCHGSAAFRTHLAAVLTRRALSRAISRADGEQTDA